MKITFEVDDEFISKYGFNIFEKMIKEEIEENPYDTPRVIEKGLNVINKIQRKTEFKLVVIDKNLEKRLLDADDISSEESYVNDMEVIIQKLQEHVVKCKKTISKAKTSK